MSNGDGEDVVVGLSLIARILCWLRAIWCFILRIFGIRRRGNISCCCCFDYPTLAEIVADASVTAALDTAFADSNANAPAVPPNPPPSQKREQGGWIIWNCNTNRYRFIRVPPGTRDGLATIVGTRPSPSYPEYLVAWFHTHPNTVPEGYAQGPSPADRAFTAATARVPGIVRSHAGTSTIPFP